MFTIVRPSQSTWFRLVWERWHPGMRRASGTVYGVEVAKKNAVKTATQITRSMKNAP